MTKVTGKLGGIWQEGYYLAGLAAKNGDSERWDRGGVAWNDIAPPPRRHRCWPQSKGRSGSVWIEQCPCGAIRELTEDGRWLDRNRRSGADLTAPLLSRLIDLFRRR
jgi:hypothetical protein